jgi:Uma2 family endonuclease
MASQPKNFLTLDEYLELERNSDTRTVYHNGEIFPIEAATEAHGILCVNAAAEIRGALQKAQKNTCRVIDSSVMVYQPDPGQVVRPDVFVVCGERCH